MAKKGDGGEAPEWAPRRLILILVAAVGLLLGVSITLGLLVTGILPVSLIADASGELSSADTEQPLPPPTYISLDPPFVVNIERPGRRGYLQVTIMVMTREPALADALQKHDPVIRNNLLMLFGSKQWQEIDGRDGRERLRHEALAEINLVLEENEAPGMLEELYFTGFVMQ